MNGSRTSIFSCLVTLLLLLLLNKVQCFSPAHRWNVVPRRHCDTLHRIQRSSSLNKMDTSLSASSPKLIVFDLDGCLWKPEMYELSWYGKGSPFQPDGNGNLISSGGNKVKLLGNVRSIFSELYASGSKVGISSRTDEPDWARELLDKFVLDDGVKPLAAVFGPLKTSSKNDLIEISYDSKVSHFQRLSKRTGIDLKEMIFFDNEKGNCVQVAKLGVTVAYVPNGVTSKLYEAALDAFPVTSGQVVNIDI